MAIAAKKRAQDWIRRIDVYEASSAEDRERNVLKSCSAEQMQETRELITFLNGKWEADRPTREQYKSVEEVHRQQVELVGEEEVLERLSKKISLREEDPIFLKEQLMLYRYRLDFFCSFLPDWAERFQTVVQFSFPCSLNLVMEHRFGWWHLKGAGTHLLPHFAMIALDFDSLSLIHI